MKTTVKIWTVLLIALLAFFSCDDDDNDVTIAKGEIAIVSTLANSDGMDGSNYLQLIGDISPASYDNSTAFPITFSCQPHLMGEDIFTTPFSTDIVKKYTRNSANVLELTGTLTADENSAPCQMVKKNDTKAYLSLMNRGKIWIINPETMIKIGEIDITAYGVGDENPDPSAMVIRNNLLYVGLNQMVGGYYPAADRAKADVLIINTETNEVVKMITEENSGMSQPCRPVDSRGIFIDENNNIYVVCMGAFGAQEGHNTGILRINSGETEFDQSFNFNLTSATIDGETNNMNVVLYSQYAGNGKLYCLVSIPAYYSNPINYIEDRICLAVEVDLNNKTVKSLGLPLSNAYGGMGKYNDYIMFGLSTDSENGFFSYNTVTGETSSEAVIKTTGYPAWFAHFGEEY